MQSPAAKTPQSPVAAGAPRDDWNRPVTLEKTPQRLVVVGPGATEIVFALGLGSKIVGRDSASDFPPAAKKIPVVADYRGPFFESVRAARPDLIIVQGETYDAARLDEWQKKCGAPVVGLAATDVKRVSKNIEALGVWLGAAPRAKTLAATLPLQDAPQSASAFLEIQRRPLMTAGKDTLVGDALARAGLVNVAAVKGYKIYNLETLLIQNPKFYVVPGDPQKRAQIVRELQNAPGFKTLECVRAGRVVVVSADWLLRPGPRLARGIAAMRAATKN